MTEQTITEQTIAAGAVVLTAANAPALGSGPVVLAGGTLQNNAGTTLTNDLVAQAGTTSVLQGVLLAPFWRTRLTTSVITVSGRR